MMKNGYSNRMPNRIRVKKRGIASSRWPVFANKTNDKKRLMEAYMAEISDNRRDALEDVEDILSENAYEIHDGKTFKEVVMLWCNKGEIDPNIIKRYTHIDYDSMARDLELSYTAVHEDSDGTVIIY